MRSLFCVLALVGLAMFAVEANAQCSAGCNVNTRQAGRTQVPAEADPVPQALTSLQIDKSEVRGYRAADVVAQRSGPPITLASYREGDELQVQPVSGQVGLFNFGGRRNDSVDAVLAEQQRSISQLQQQVAEARARGQEVTMQDVQRAIMANQPQLTPDEMFRIVRSSPEFQDFLRQTLATRQEAEIVSWEIVPVE